MDTHWIHLFAISIVIVGALNWGILGITGKNVVESLLGRIGARLVYVLVGLCALYVMMKRETYLPFLGETVIPCSVLKIQTPEHADTVVPVHGLEPEARVLYWASEPATDGLTRINDWRKAYLTFANAGVAVVDADGHVELKIRRPQPYTVPIKGRLEAHVHWRVCGPNGFLGPVQFTPVPL
jgi:uncharacterized membrane protein YuzA (DUF378 family)